MRFSGWTRSSLVWLCVAGGGQAAQAELVYFKAGGRVQLPAAAQGDLVIISAPDGNHAFRHEDAAGFVRLWGLSLETVARRQGTPEG